MLYKSSFCSLPFEHSYYLSPCIIYDVYYNVICGVLRVLERRIYHTMLFIWKRDLFIEKVQLKLNLLLLLIYSEKKVRVLTPNEVGFFLISSARILIRQRKKSRWTLLTSISKLDSLNAETSFSAMAVHRLQILKATQNLPSRFFSKTEQWLTKLC